MNTGDELINEGRWADVTRLIGVFLKGNETVSKIVQSVLKVYSYISYHTYNKGRSFPPVSQIKVN